MHILFLCIRFLRKRRIAFFGTAAVALCVALLIVITSLFNGFIRSFGDYWRAEYGDILFQPRTPISGYSELATLFEKIDGVQTALPVVTHGGLLYLGKGDVRAVQMRGIHLERWLKIDRFKRGIHPLTDDKTRAGFDLSPATLQQAGQWFEERFGRAMTLEDQPAAMYAGVGIFTRPDELTDEYDTAGVLEELRQMQAPLSIITGRQVEGDDGPGLKKSSRLCWPVGVVQTGMDYIDSANVYLPFDFVAALAGQTAADGTIKCLAGIHINCQPGADISPIMDQIYRLWQQYAREVLKKDRQDIPPVSLEQTAQNAGIMMFTGEIRKQLLIMQVILGLICLVAALLVFVILTMIVMQKKRDIGIIRALGSSRGGVAGLFILYGGGIGLAGSIAGVVLGVLGTWNMAALEQGLSGLLGFKIWKSGVYLFSEIPHQVDWPALLWIVLTGIVTAIMGALLPAWRAARLQPVESLRYE